MPYYTSGTMHSLIGEHPLFPTSKRARHSKQVMGVDMPREVCLDESDALDTLAGALERSKNAEWLDEYIQGQLSGRVLKYVFGKNYPFSKKDTDDPRIVQDKDLKDPAAYYHNRLQLFYKALYAENGFIFKQRGGLGALSFGYLPGNPTASWFVAIAHGIEKPPQECRVDIFSSAAPGGLSGSEETKLESYQPVYKIVEFEQGMKKLLKRAERRQIHELLPVLLSSKSQSMTSAALGLASFNFPHLGAESPPPLAELTRRAKQHMLAYQIFADTMLETARMLDSSKTGLAFVEYFGNYEKSSGILPALENLIATPSPQTQAAFETSLEPVKRILAKHSMLQGLWFRMLTAMYYLLGLVSQQARDIFKAGHYRKTASLQFFDSSLAVMQTHLKQESQHTESDNLPIPV